jgi:hypothetical protein
MKFLSSDSPKPLSDTYTFNHPSGGQGQFCVGIHRYNFQIGQQVGGSVYGLERDTLNAVPAVCPPSSGFGSVAISQPEQLLDSGMQLNSIGINCTNGRCIINAHVVFYGSDHTVLASGTGGFNQWQAPDSECTGGVQTSQFCAVADYDRTVILQ